MAEIRRIHREIYVTDGEFILYPIADEDHENYVELHRQLNGEDTLFLNPYCKDMMWEQVLSGKDKVYSVFDNNDAAKYQYKKASESDGAVGCSVIFLGFVAFIVIAALIGS